MQTVNQIFKAQVQIKKSNFLSFLCPFKDFKNLLENLKKEHSKASHFVYAYRTLNPLNQIIEAKNDDKEPKGSSAMPILNLLRAYELVNVALITVRYFGGIKLGVGGLVRAYSKGANTVINSAFLLNFELKKNTSFAIDFKILKHCEHFLKMHHLDFKKDFKNHKLILTLKLSKEEEQNFELFCKQFKSHEIKRL